MFAELTFYSISNIYRQINARGMAKQLLELELLRP